MALDLYPGGYIDLPRRLPLLLHNTRLPRKRQVVRKPSAGNAREQITYCPTLFFRLSEDERSYVKARLHEDQGRNAVERAISFRDVVNVFKDYKIFVGGFMYFGLIVPAYGYAFFAPGIIQRWSPWAWSFSLAY